MSTRRHVYFNAEGVQRVAGGHPWLTARHLQKNARLPQIPALCAIDGRWYFLSPQSHLRLRRFSVDGPEATSNIFVSCQDFANTFAVPLEKHFKDLFVQKKVLVEGNNLFRWVFSESDGIPGLIIDVFEDIVVCQIQTAPIELFWPCLSECLHKAFLAATGSRIRTLVEKRSHPLRSKEGLAVVSSDILQGEPLSAQKYAWNGLLWNMTPGQAQKTGAYLDQRENHLATVAWAKRLGLKEALDVCSFEGGFGIHLLKAGLSVTAVDISDSAIQRLQSNAALNFKDPKLSTVCADAFDFLREFHKSGRRVDLIVLDPPPFAKNKEQADKGFQGFLDLNLRAVLALKPGGLLVSCSCSQAVGFSEMTKIFRKIAASTGRSLKILETRGPAADHLAPIHFPEGQYLNAWLIQVY